MRRVLGLLVSIALMLGVGVVGPVWAAPADGEDEQGSATSGGALVRPDWVSAVVTARAQGVRVEVLSERTESSRVFARPDGAVEEEISAGPVRYRDANAAEGWRDIDTSLRVSGAGVVPVSMPVDVVLSGGPSTSDLVVFDAEGAGEVAVALQGVVLPKPLLEGSTARYPDVFPGVDVSVEVRSGGFELLWVVKNAAAAKWLVGRFGGAGGLKLPLAVRSRGSVAAERDGGVGISKNGKPIGRFASPSMWDSNAAIPGEKGAERRVGFGLGKTDSTARRALSGQAVEVRADTQWLLDPAREFPISIDPTYAVATGGPVFDTFVQQGFTSDQSGSGELKVGNNGQGQVARSFLNFDAGLFRGRQIVRAELSLWESWSWSCSARSFSAYDAGLASRSTWWTSQPRIGAKRGSVSVAKGYSSSCPAGRVAVPMTDQARAWASTAQSQVGVMLRADSESDKWGWKRFHSSEGSRKPVLTVVYNRAPGTPGVPVVDGLVSAKVADGSTKLFLGNPKPRLRVPVSDPDKDSVKVQFAYFYTSGNQPVVLCEAGAVASGGTASCTSQVAIPDNKNTWIRARSFDGRVWSGWGPGKEVRPALIAPYAPIIACPVSGNKTWVEQVRPAETCTLTARHTSWSSSPTKMTWRVNGGAWQEKTFNQISADTKAADVRVGGVPGGHQIEAYVTSPTGKKSAISTYSFGYGAPSLVTPTAAVTTHGGVKVEGVGAPAQSGLQVQGAIQWRVKGSTIWYDSSAKVTADPAKTMVSGLLDTSQILEAHPELSKRASVVLETRVKFTYGLSTLVTSSREVVRVPHAFGAGFPVDEVAGGQVALWTGELQVSTTDGELSTPTGELSVSRTHSTFAGEMSPAQGVFGPGWVASLDGGPTGVSEMELIDNTLFDGTLVLASADGQVLPFGAPNDGSVRTGATLAVGEYAPIGAEAESSELRVQVSGNGAATKVTVIDEDGVHTRFTTRTAPTTTGEAKFITDSVWDSATGETTSYRYDSQGRVTDIIAPKPDGVTMECVPGKPVAGCRILRLSYATATGNGDYQGRLKSITAQAGTDVKELSRYRYDSSGRLVAQTDVVTGLTTTYTWDGASQRLASVTDPGLATVSYHYSAGKLVKVTRPVPASAGGGTAQLAAVVADQPLDAVPGLDLTQFDAYGLPRRATKVFAVFGPDQVIDGAPTEEAWQRADVWLTDDMGYTIHEGSFGGGAWQLTANVYDESDNVTHSWDARATAAIRSGDITDISAAATTTVFNQTPITDADGMVLVPARTRVEHVYTPAAVIRTKGSDVAEMLRKHVATIYDEGAPTPGLSLPTKIQVTAERPDGTVVETLTTTFTGYDKLEASDSKSGWDLRTATSVTLDMNSNGVPDSADIRRETRYDAQGRVIEQRQPGAGSTDPGTRRTVYWTAGTNPTDPSCGRQPAWAGYVCSEGPASQPSGTPLPVTYHRDYQWHGAAATEQDISGAVTRTTTTTFDGKMRPATVSTTVTGRADSTPVPAVTTTYDDATGLVTGNKSAAGSTTMSYDSWGRQLTYTTSGSGTTTTTYNHLGDITKVVTPQTETTFTYDGTDANGQMEYRGLLTKTTVHKGTQTWTAAAAYDAQGQLLVEKLPGEIERHHVYDLTGELISQHYDGTVTNPDTGTRSIQPWLAWSLEVNAAGQIVHERNPDGAAFTGAVAGAQAVAADLTYSYDPAGRLTKVVDQSDEADGTGCRLRTYRFDVRGNRLANTTAAATTGMPCPATPGAETHQGYDAADRPTTAGDGTVYTYDPLGRQTLIPAADAPHPESGDVRVSYYDDDTAKAITQAGVSVSYGLDVAGRRTVQTTRRTLESTVTESVTNHYVDDSDNPGWVTTVTADRASTTAYADLTSGGLSLSITTTGDITTGELALANPRGDVSATITLPADGEIVQGLDRWTRYTEYGTPVAAPFTGAGGVAANGYGWLGVKQRSTTETGILLMGARLYNPVTGLFTSLDPIYGGNDTPYTYPNDPINKQDTTGERGWWARAAKFLGKVSDAAAWIPGLGQTVSTVAGYASAYAHLRAGNRREARSRAISTTMGFFGGGYWQSSWPRHRPGGHAPMGKESDSSTRRKECQASQTSYPSTTTERQETR